MRHLFVTFTLFYSSVILAQENTVSVSVPHTSKEIEIKIKLSDFEKLNKEKDNAIAIRDSLLGEYNELLGKYNKLSKDYSIKTVNLSKLNKDYPVLKDKYNKLVKSQEKADKCLLNMAFNFLYIPYEDYSIQEIAIPAFEAVSNQELKNQHKIKYDLLKSYKTDIESLLEFIETTEKELRIPFTKDAKEQFAKFQNIQLSVNYRKYNDWSNTYIGKIIITIEGQLKAFDGKTRKMNLESIKNELILCLKTIESL